MELRHLRSDVDDIAGAMRLFERSISTTSRDFYSSFAGILVDYSTKVKEGEIVVIETFDVPQEMIDELASHINKRGAHPIIWQKNWALLRTVLKGASQAHIDLISDAELSVMQKANVYIGVRASYGSKELEGVPQEKLNLFQQNWLGRVHYGWRVHNTRWCSVKWPTEHAAKLAGMTFEEYLKFYMRVCIGIDYEKMSQAMDSLVRMMKDTDKVHVLAPETDISFSIKGIPVQKCAGNINIPDGEVLTAPVRDSVNGVIAYNIPSSYMGSTFEGIKIYVKDGCIISASCEKGDKDKLKKIINSDDGSNYFGEFAFGINPYVVETTGDTMFDEKMGGSIHLTPGNSYSFASNGNKSRVHWDLILNLNKAFGGGEIYFDNRLISKDGLFVPDELKCLNPDQLTAKGKGEIENV